MILANFAEGELATNMGRRGILSDLDETQNIKVSSQAIGKFSNKIDPSHLDKIVKNLQSYFPKIRRILAVDGSSLSMSKLINIENPLFTLTPSKSYATASLTCIFDVIQKIPIAFNLRPTGDERKGFMALIDHLKKGDLVIFDRGYFDVKLVKALNKRMSKY